MADSLQSCNIPAFQVPAVDTTGAGDAFSAGFLFGYLHQWDACLCGTLANAVGALATTVYGAGVDLPGRFELMQLLQTASTLEGCLIESVPRLCGLLEKQFSDAEP